MDSGIIYKYTSPSRKVYIGQTISEKTRRNTFLNIKCLYAGGKIDKARQKYGPENFKYEILDTITDLDKKQLLKQLNKLETYYISKYDSFRNGYNSTPGGQFIYVYTNGDKEKISKSKSKPVIQYDLYGNYVKIWDSSMQASKELNINAQCIRNCCNEIQAHANIYQWRWYIEDFSLKIDSLPEDKIDSILKSKDSHNSTNGRTFKKVIQYDLNGDFIRIFNSLTEAAKSVGISSTTCISQCCKNLGASYGYIWRFYSNNFDKHIEPNLSQHSLIVANKKNFKIYQYDLNNNLINTWNTYKEITDSLGICRTGIYQCCTGKLKTYKNYIWSYV